MLIEAPLKWNPKAGQVIDSSKDDINKDSDLKESGYKKGYMNKKSPNIQLFLLNEEIIF
jgi:hypothetical protein